MGSFKQDLKDSALGFAETAQDKWHSFRQFVREAWPLLAILLACLIGVWWYADPPPPRHIYMASGSPGGSYEILTNKYVEYFKKRGIQIELVPTSGAEENLQRLSDPNDPIKAAFVQAGLANPQHSKGLSSLGSVDYEPFWFFYQGDEIKVNSFVDAEQRILDLLKKKVSIDERGTGTHTQVSRILEVAGLGQYVDDLLAMPAKQAIEALQKKQINGLYLVDGYQAKNTQALFADPNLHLSAAWRAEAYAKALPYLRILNVPMGSFNLAKNLPDRNIQLLSTTTNLLIKADMHPAIQFLFLEAAREINGRASFFAKEGEFPSFNTYGVSDSPVAVHYKKNGSPYILSLFPFWIAELVDRIIFVFLPFFLMAYPIILSLPGYRTKRMQRKINRLYDTLKKYEQELMSSYAPEQRDEYLKKLDLLEYAAIQLTVPSSMAGDYYSLRSDIEYVRSCLNRGNSLYQMRLDLEAGRGVVASS